MWIRSHFEEIRLIICRLCFNTKTGTILDICDDETETEVSGFVLHLLISPCSSNNDDDADEILNTQIH